MLRVLFKNRVNFKHAKGAVDFLKGNLGRYYTSQIMSTWNCVVVYQQVILSDGDLSTLANMKFNLELNHLNVETDMPQGNNDPSMVSLNLHKLRIRFCFFAYKYNPHGIHVSGFAYILSFLLSHCKY